MLETLLLERFGHEPGATWGRLTLPADGGVFFMVEPPWVYNRRGESCIPCGTYQLERHDSKRHPHSWALVGPGVSHFEEPQVDRFACLWHSANYPSELKGCGAPGSRISVIRGRQCVTSSADTLRRLDEILSAMEKPRVRISSTLAVGW